MYTVIIKTDTKGHKVYKFKVKAEGFFFKADKGCRHFVFYDAEHNNVADVNSANVIAIYKV